ncbi:hypothetical protein L332_02400 [Agrococcus pavilionensis RW1]|uniref:DUF4194 domain-containing protein n=1 Tax=Agrococcus pavilionensis RW1 TaxID=1330458 RepID=U1LLY5_9MICO|nr:DUF4194 domain-containing protein [Agrococcus pavilionensis]ERG63304.1 hypothetical protein L332_02400 [Agrococcus pavilionensis RW1]
MTDPHAAALKHAAPDEERADASTGSSALWPGDSGRLREDSRRALLELIQGPYLSSSNRGRLWVALLADADEIRSRLHELFLELVIDRNDEIAFVRPVDAGERPVPLAVRSRALTFMDTLMLLVLRQRLLAARGERRVFVDRSDVFEQLAPYRVARDEADFERRMNASWTKLMNKLGLIHRAGGDDRVEISPALRLIFDDDRVQSLRREYERVLERGGEAALDLDAAADADDRELTP